MDDLLSEFLTETSEGLAMLDVELVKLEQNPNDPNLLGNIFRIVHTIKGTCGFLSLPRLESVAHASENVLGRVRDGELTVTPTAVTLILASLDRIKQILGVLEATEAEPQGDDAVLIEQLNALAEGRAVVSADMDELIAGPVAEAPVIVKEVVVKEVVVEEVVVAAPVVELPKAKAKAKAPAKEVAPPPAPEPVVEAVPDNVVSLPARMEAEGEMVVKSEDAPKTDVAVADGPAKESAVAASNIRVNVDLLENLMTMVSELVLTRNQLMQILRGHKDSEFGASLQRLSHVTTELQEGVMKTRMQPIGNAWAKLPRVIRDLGVELHKKIELKMLGAETELDRQVLELIKDPLTHMVRNSADHGIEMPADRVRAGKPDVGTVTLNAFHEGGHIVIEISDDGRGLGIDRIKQKALSTKLATEADLASMTDQQIYQFIFKAGFSTASQVTSVSGRGVGMDVVRTNIEKIGGTVELKSQPGKGSSFTIKIPLTLAIVSALIVESASERFAIPQISVVELVRASANSEHHIERIKDTPVLRLRDRLLPLVSLRELLKLDDSKGQSAEETYIVVSQVGTYTFGIIVDQVFDTEEIVVKPVAPILRDIPMFSGNTVLGDGQVIMILDPNGIAASTGEISLGESHNREQVAQKGLRSDLDRTSMLLFRAGPGAPMAVPLALVARLEEIDRKDMEFSNGKPVVQYRGKLMPLVPIDPAAQIGGEGRQPILVFADGERSMGLLVEEIIDIVEEKMTIELGSQRPGLVGSAIFAGNATDVVDTGYYLTQAYDDWFGTTREAAFGQTVAAKRILLIDDSPFFRNMLTPLLSVAGYDVSTVDSGNHALDLCEAGEDFDIIISDIEMPGMNGFQFVEAVKSAGRWRDTPIVALSSHATPRDLDRGRAVGFSDYVAKFDRDALLHALQATLSIHQGAA